MGRLKSRLKFSALDIFLTPHCDTRIRWSQMGPNGTEVLPNPWLTALQPNKSKPGCQHSGSDYEFGSVIVALFRASALHIITLCCCNDYGPPLNIHGRFGAVFRNLSPVQRIEPAFGDGDFCFFVRS